MANTKSIKKVIEYLKTKEDAVSPSEISSEAMLKYKSVKEVLEFLQQTNQIVILTTGKTTLVKFEGDRNATN